MRNGLTLGTNAPNLFAVKNKKVIGVRYEILAGVYLFGSVTFCILRELSFAIVKDRFSLVGINFCDF